MNLFEGILNRKPVYKNKDFTPNTTDAFGSASNFFGTAPSSQNIMPTAYKPAPVPQQTQGGKLKVEKQQKQVGLLFSDEKSAYDKMKADGIDDETALKVIGERRKNIRDTVGIPQLASQEEAQALAKMQADGLDAISAAGMIKQYRSQFKDAETQKFEEAYKKGNIAQKGAYNLLAGAAGNLETIAKYGGNALDFITFGKAGFGEDVKAMEQVTQSPQFQSSSAFKAGTYLPDVAIGVSPLGAGYMAGAKGVGSLALRSGAVGTGFGATQPVLEKGSEATMGDIATGGAVGGVAGAVLSPVIGIAGKGIIKGAQKIGKYGTALQKGGIEGVQKSVARDINAFKTPGVETVTRNIPKAVVRRDLGFTPTERAKIEKITGTDEATYILNKGLAGKGKEELAETFMKQSDDMYNGITKELGKVNAKVQSPVAKEALLDIMEQLESSPKIARAYAKDIEGVKAMLARDEFTLSELNNIRRAYDKVNTGMFTVQGKARSGLENAIDVKVRQDLSNQLQNEAKKYGVDVKAMNTELRAGLEMKDALLRGLSQEERNNFIGLQDLGVSAILSGGNPVSAVATIAAKKYAEKVAPGLAQKAYNLNKAPNVTRTVSRGNTITPRNKSTGLGLASKPSDIVVSDGVEQKIVPKPTAPKGIVAKKPIVVPKAPIVEKKGSVESKIIDIFDEDTRKSIFVYPSKGYNVPKNADIYPSQSGIGVSYKGKGRVDFYISIKDGKIKVSTDGLGGNATDFIQDAWKRVGKDMESKLTLPSNAKQQGIKPKSTTTNIFGETIDKPSNSKGGFIKIPEIGKKVEPKGIMPKTDSLIEEARQENVSGLFASKKIKPEFTIDGKNIENKMSMFGGKKDIRIKDDHVAPLNEIVDFGDSKFNELAKKIQIKTKQMGPQGSYRGFTIYLKNGLSPLEQKNVISHEFQHFLDETFEGPSGGNKDMFLQTAKGEEIMQKNNYQHSLDIYNDLIDFKKNGTINDRTNRIIKLYGDVDNAIAAAKESVKLYKEGKGPVDTMDTYRGYFSLAGEDRAFKASGEQPMGKQNRKITIPFNKLEFVLNKGRAKKI